MSSRIHQNPVSRCRQGRGSVTSVKHQLELATAQQAITNRFVRIVFESYIAHFPLQLSLVFLLFLREINCNNPITHCNSLRPLERAKQLAEIPRRPLWPRYPPPRAGTEHREHARTQQDHN